MIITSKPCDLMHPLLTGKETMHSVKVGTQRTTQLFQSPVIDPIFSIQPLKTLLVFDKTKWLTIKSHNTSRLNTPATMEIERQIFIK